MKLCGFLFFGQPVGLYDSLCAKCKLYAGIFQIKGSVADVDGQLVPGDQILVVNGIDVRSSQQQETAALLKVQSSHIM